MLLGCYKNKDISVQHGFTSELFAIGLLGYYTLCHKYNNFKCCYFDNLGRIQPNNLTHLPNRSNGSLPSYNHPGAALIEKSLMTISGDLDSAPSKASDSASTWNPKVAITMAAALATAGTGGKQAVDTRLRATPRRIEDGNSARKQLGGTLKTNRELAGSGLPMTPQAASRRAEFEVLPFAQEWVLRACRIAAGPSHQTTNAQTSSSSIPAVPCSTPLPASTASAGAGVSVSGASGPGGLFLGYGCLFGGDGSAWMPEVQEQQQPSLCCRLEPTRIEPDLVPPVPPIAATSTGTPAVRTPESPGGHRPAPKETLNAEMDPRQCEPPANVEAAAQWPALYFPFLNTQPTPQQ